MSLSPLPFQAPADVPTRWRRMVEKVNNVLNFQYDDSRIQTPAEKLAGVTPVNYAYPEGWLQRYGAKNDGITDNTIAIQACISVCQYLTGGTSYGQSLQGLPGVYRHTASLVITAAMTITPPTIAGPRVFTPVGGGSTAYGGIEFLFDPPSNPANRLLPASFAIQLNIGIVGSEGYARVRIQGLGVSWTQVNCGGIYIVGAQDVEISDCWLTGGLTNYASAAGIGIYCLDAIVSHFYRNTFKWMAFGIVAENYWNENIIERNDFELLTQAAVLVRGKAGSSVRSTVSHNNVRGDGTHGPYGVYLCGTVNGVSIDENTFEVLTTNPIAVTNVDLIDSTNNGTPADIHIGKNTFIATNSLGGTAITLSNCSGASIWGNQLLSPSGPLSALIDVTTNCSNVNIWGNDPAGKPLVIGTLSTCVILDDLLYRTLPTDSSESTKVGWTTANSGALWWNATIGALRAWVGIATPISIQPCSALQLASNAATPAVGGINILELQYTSATNITNLTGAFPGQEVTLIYLSGAGVPTIVNGTFILQGAANFVMASHNTLTVIFDGSNWWEKGRKT